MDRGIGFSNLLALAEKTGECRLVKDMLLETPGPARFTGEMAEFQNQYERLRASLKRCGVSELLLDLYLLTQLLVHRQTLPKWFVEWVHNHIRGGERLIGVALAEAVRGHWGVIPVLTFRDNMVVYRLVATGMMPLEEERGAGLRLPDWARKVLDDDALTAFQNGFKAACRLQPIPYGCSMVVFPLLSPNETIQLRGGSLGLPVALGFVYMMNRLSPPAVVAASGAIDPYGGVQPVGHLSEKMRMAAHRGHGIFLYPSDNVLPGADSHCMQRLPVVTLDDAWMLSELYRIDPDRRLALFYQITQDAGLLAQNAHLVSPRWLRWAAENGHLDAGVRAIMADPAKFETLSNHFMTCAQCFDLDVADAMAAAFDAAQVQSAAAKAPLAVYRWCAADIARRNHHGMVIGEQDPLVRKALSLSEKVRSADLSATADFFNYLLVARHNRYEFKPELPGELQDLLHRLEHQHQQMIKFGCAVDIPLGRLYGTLAQNCAFCGPQWIAETLIYSRKALCALGEGTVPEYAEKWRRQYNYMTYACLDAKAYASARENLQRYLEMETSVGLPDLFPSLSRWHHAAVARYLATVADTRWREAYLAIDMDRTSSFMGVDHPSQLWHHNMGLIFEAIGRADKAVAFHRKSLELCLQRKHGPTIHVMALMPLAHLQALKCASADIFDPARVSILEAARQLDKNHFQGLDEAQFPVILAEVRQRPQSLFPFTYR